MSRRTRSSVRAAAATLSTIAELPSLSLAPAPYSVSSSISPPSSPPAKRRKREQKKNNIISDETRNSIISFYTEHAWDAATLAIHFHLPVQTIYSILNVFHKENRIIKKRKSGRPPRVTEEIEQRILQLAEERNDSTLKEIRDALEFDEKEPINVSETTIHRVLKKNNYSYKKLVYIPTERNTPANIEKRKNYSLWAISIDKERMIFLDETGFNLHIRRRYGRSKRGRRAVVVQPADKETNISVLAAFSPISGIIKYKSKIGAFTAIEYEQFVAELLREARFLVRSHYLIHDNARIHRKRELENILSGLSVHHEVHFLPPYSPQLNPIQLCFSVWKAAVKAEKLENRNTQARLTTLIDLTVSSVTPEKAQRMYHHVTRFYVHCAASKPLDEKYDPYTIV